MISFKSLDISDYRSEPLANTFIRQDRVAEQLAVVLPGLGYTAHMPVLYYPTRLLVDRGVDVLRVEYDYQRNPAFGGASGAERDRWLLADAAAALEAGLAQRPYKQIVLIGKSLGTQAMGHLIATDMRLKQASCIWLTLLVRDETLCQHIKQEKPRSLFVMGTVDPQYDPVCLAELVEVTQGQSLVIEGADHSLEIAGSIPASLRTLAQVMQAVDAFLTDVP